MTGFFLFPFNNAAVFASHLANRIQPKKSNQVFYQEASNKPRGCIIRRWKNHCYCGHCKTDKNLLRSPFLSLQTPAAARPD
jgi:hypothetical protein